MSNETAAEIWAESMVPNYGTPAMQLVSGKGSYVTDANGNQYLDLLGGIAVSVLGHANEAVTDAIAEQSKKILHTSNLYMNQPSLELAQKLIKLSGFDSKVFFCQDGATANEAALKLVRKYGNSKSPNKNVIIAMKNGFHGRTSGALAITGNPAKRDPFAPFGYEVRFVDYNDVVQLRAAFSDDVAGIFVETVQGEGGMHFAKPEFLKSCQELANENEALFIVDEVQSAVGRTGTFFHFEQFDLAPDIVTLAKGLAGGLPIGAMVVRSEYATHFAPGDHGSTFGGNPVSAAAANAVVEIVSTPDFLSNVTEIAKWFSDEVSSLKLSDISEIKSAGLWFGIQLTTDIASDVATKALKNGFLVNAVKPNVIRLAPPLNISKAELQTFVDLLPELLQS
ncbi:MAG: hypothetical protein RLZZ330_1158 [Actinomycetota bacterium]|jgi:acetylornithine aminotransferase